MKKLNNGKFGNTVFDYIDYRPESPNETEFKVFSLQEINKMVDLINQQEEQLIVNHIHRTIRQLDDVYQKIYNKVHMSSTDFILKLNPMELEKYELTELVEEYKELKLILCRLKNKKNIIIPYVKPKELTEFNVRNFLIWQSTHNNSIQLNSLNQFIE